VQEAGWSLSVLARILSEAPAALVGLADRKGAIREGLDADLVVWDPAAFANTSVAACRHKWKSGPYIDKELRGQVKTTLVKGGVVFHSDLGGFSDDGICGGAVFVGQHP
jgi:allantoinase